MELAELRPQTNSWLKSHNGRNHKGTEFRRPIKIGVKIKSKYIGRIVLSRAAMEKVETLRICESKRRGSEEDNTTI